MTRKERRSASMRSGHPLLVLLLIGCGSTEPTRLDTLEPGRYILSSFDGKQPPLSVIEWTYPDVHYTSGIEFDTVIVESSSVFRRAFKAFDAYHFSGERPETSWTIGSYRGAVLERDGAFLLVMNQVPYNVAPLEVRAYPDVLLRRLSLQIWRCTGNPSIPCEIVRQGLLDASYVRR